METLHAGLTEYLLRTEGRLKEKESHITTKMEKECSLLLMLQEKVNKIQTSISKQLAFYEESKNVTTHLHDIRQTISTLLGGMKSSMLNIELKDDIILPCLKVIEDTTKLESVEIPFLEQSFSSKYRSLHEKLEATTKGIEGQEKTLEKEIGRREKTIGNFFNCKQLLEEFAKTTQDGTALTGPIDNIIGKLKKTISEEIKGQDELITRPLPTKSLPPPHTKHKDPYVNPDQLLDMILFSKDEVEYHCYLQTYHYYSTPFDLLTKLIVRYCLTPPPPFDCERMKEHKQSIFDFLLFWVENYYISDLCELHGDITHFLYSIAQPTENNVEALIRQKLEEQEKENFLRAKADANSEWKRVTLPTPIKNSDLPAENVILQKPKLLAEQLALYEQKLYQAIQFQELIGQKWGKDDASRVPHLNTYLKHFNAVVHWCISTILGTKSAIERSKVISNIIFTMVISYQLNNFLGAFEFLFALNSVGVHRLSKTWHLLPLSKRRIVWVFTKFTQSGFKLYKKSLNKVVPPAIPYLGTTLADMTFIEDGNPSLKDKKVNYFFKCMKVHETIKKALSWQSDAYNIKPDSDVQSFFNLHFNTDARPMTEDEIYEKSSALEKKGPNSFSFDKCSDEEILQEMVTYQGILILQEFDDTIKGKRSTTLQRLGAKDFLKAKTGRSRTPSLSSSGPVSVDSRAPSLVRQDTWTFDGNFLEPHRLQELVVHMKIPGGITQRTRVFNGVIERYFLSKVLMDWLVHQLNDYSRCSASDVAARLFHEGHIVALEGKNSVDPDSWSSSPLLKLCFAKERNQFENFGVMDLSADIFSETVDDSSEFESDYEDLHDGEEDPFAKSSTDPRDLSLTDLSGLVEKMRHPQSGVTIKNRKWLLKRFPRCFVGEQAVTWLAYQLQVSREQATLVGTLLVENQFMHHVARDHGFEDKYLFYRFALDEKPKKEK